MDNELYHYGVLGMKWGVRRSRRKSSYISKKKRKKAASTKNMSADAKELARLKKKSVSQMSNAELRKYNERAQLEQQYAKLNPSDIKRGIAIVGTVAGTLGTVVSLYNSGNQLVTAGKKVFNGVVKAVEKAEKAKK